MPSNSQSSCDEQRIAKLDAELADESPVAQQPCSGTLVVRSSVFGAGASAASPDIVCSMKRAS